MSIHFWGPWHKADMALLKGVQRGATTTIRVLEPFFCEYRLGHLGLYSLEKSGLWGNLPVAFQYIEWGHYKAFLIRPVGTGQEAVFSN